MDIFMLKEKIKNLDPNIHKGLRDALTIGCSHLTGAEKSPSPACPAELFKKALDELNTRYIEGTIDYIRKHELELYNKINELEDRLNEVWLKGLQGKAELNEFEEVLKKWRLCHLKGIELYSNTKKESQRG